jgi:hypothetical protein
MRHYIGEKINRLTVLEKRGVWHLCRCDCGREKIIRTDKLRDGRAKSCGCLVVEMRAAERAAADARAKARQAVEDADRAKWMVAIEKLRIKPDSTERKLKAVWYMMMQRCYNLKNKDYPRYGGRGIVVCDRWQSRDLFLADMVPLRKANVQKRSLERMDNDGPYSPDNCTFVKLGKQADNRRDSLRFSDGTTLGAMFKLCRVPYMKSWVWFQNKLKDGVTPTTDEFAAWANDLKSRV